MSFGYFSKELVLERAQARYDEETERYKRCMREFEEYKQQCWEAHEKKSWFARKFLSDPADDIEDYARWDLSVKLSWPEEHQTRLTALIAMTKKAEGDVVALSPNDAKFLNLHE